MDNKTQDSTTQVLKARLDHEMSHTADLTHEFIEYINREIQTYIDVDADYRLMKGDHTQVSILN